MNRNLFLKEIRRNAVSLAIWMTVITMLIVITLSFYRTFMGKPIKDCGDAQSGSKRRAAIQRDFEFSMTCFRNLDFMLPTMLST